MSGSATLTGELAGSIEMAPHRSRAEGPPRRARYVAAGLALVAIALVLVAWFVQLSVADRLTTLESHLASRLDALARGRAEVIATWLEGGERSAGRIIGSELFRLFVQELALARSDGLLATSLAEQMPYMAQALDELANQQGLTAVRLLGRDGALLMSDSNAAAAVPGLAALARATAIEGSGARVGTARFESGALVVDVVLPIPPPQTDTNAFDVTSERVNVGAVVLSVPAAELLQRILGPVELDAPGEATRLLLPAGDGEHWLIAAWRGGDANAIGLEPASSDALPGSAQGLTIREHGWPQPVYAVTRPVPRTAWSVIQTVDREIALEPLRRYERQAQAWAACLAGALALLLTAVWWRQRCRHEAALAAQYRDLAARIDRQRRLLDSITASVPDMIGLKGRDGRYVFANAAFGRALGRSSAEIVGSSDADLFPAATARLFDRTDREALALGIVVIEDERVEIAGRERWLHHAKVPFMEPGGTVGGVMSVARDVSELVEQRRRRERLIEQTVAALVRTVELVDSYLLGHTQRVGDVAATIGARLGLDGPSMATLRLAARLSQIGKIFVPREILAKPGRHTDEEIAIMRSHVDHASSVLRGIDFELPVAETILQMHERLDGTGYPAGLRAEAIGRLGRILAVADVFCARTAPRSYRERVPSATALHHLRHNPQRYDANVVTVLEAAMVELPGKHDPTERAPVLPGPGETSVAPSQALPTAAICHETRTL